MKLYLDHFVSTRKFYYNSYKSNEYSNFYNEYKLNKDELNNLQSKIYWMK